MTGSLARACTLVCERDGAEHTGARAQPGRHDAGEFHISVQQLGDPAADLWK